ncbi:hypothetical protein CMALT394_210133 [Carnobacterium maltaromaticum]|nr:hypothetical protein CMALT394_210133 [Carnobacterium maltaromaticum]
MVILNYTINTPILQCNSDYLRAILHFVTLLKKDLKLKKSAYIEK